MARDNGYTSAGEASPQTTALTALRRSAHALPWGRQAPWANGRRDARNCRIWL